MSYHVHPAVPAQQVFLAAYNATMREEHSSADPSAPGADARETPDVRHKAYQAAEAAVHAFLAQGDTATSTPGASTGAAGAQVIAAGSGAGVVARDGRGATVGAHTGGPRQGVASVADARAGEAPSRAAGTTY
jgi:hypothetical protein